MNAESGDLGDFDDGGGGAAVVVAVAVDSEDQDCGGGGGDGMMLTNGDFERRTCVHCNGIDRRCAPRLRLFKAKMVFGVFDLQFVFYLGHGGISLYICYIVYWQRFKNVHKIQNFEQ